VQQSIKNFLNMVQMTASRFRAIICGGFTLIEILFTILIISILTTIGVSMFANTTTQERRTASETLTAMVDLARRTAEARRKEVILAFASPEEIPGHGQALRLGMFLCEDTWPGESGSDVAPTGPIRCRALHRWRNLNAGVVLLPGSGGHPEMTNPLDAAPLQLHYGRGFALSATVHALVFSPQGGLAYPSGNFPALLRLAAGNYRHGIPQPSRQHDPTRPPENPLQIGRTIARAMETTP
jgi:prepilin-type N-terminal cleavage/methylation domain-containing protein